MGALEQTLTNYQGNLSFRNQTLDKLRVNMPAASYEAHLARGRAINREQLNTFIRSEVAHLINTRSASNAT